MYAPVYYIKVECKGVTFTQARTHNEISVLMKLLL